MQETLEAADYSEGLCEWYVVDKLGCGLIDFLYDGNQDYYMSGEDVNALNLATTHLHAAQQQQLADSVDEQLDLLKVEDKK